jgi:hypothetical protein
LELDELHATQFSRLEFVHQALNFIQTLRKRKHGEISYFEAVKKMKFRESRDKSISYMGFALKKFKG